MLEVRRKQVADCNCGRAYIRAYIIDTLNFPRWDCINARQRKRDKRRRVAHGTSLLSSRARAERRETAGLSADSAGIHRRDRLRAGGKRIRTLGPTSVLEPP